MEKNIDTEKLLKECFDVFSRLLSRIPRHYFGSEAKSADRLLNHLEFDVLPKLEEEQIKDESTTHSTVTSAGFNEELYWPTDNTYWHTTDYLVSKENEKEKLSEIVAKRNKLMLELVHSYYTVGDEELEDAIFVLMKKNAELYLRLISL